MSDPGKWVTHQKRLEDNIPSSGGVFLWVVPVGIVTCLVVLAFMAGRLFG
jgi:hypothetical protein